MKTQQEADRRERPGLPAQGGAEPEEESALHRAFRTFLNSEVFAGCGPEDPKECRRAYEVWLTHGVNMAEFREDDLLELLEAFNRGRGAYDPVQRENEEDVAYAALYCLNILYRHAFDVVKFQKVAQENRAWCARRPTFRYLEIMQHSQINEALRGKEDLFLGELCQFSDDHPDNAGYAHAVANLYAAACESNYDRQEHFRRKWGEKAEKYIRRAIALDSTYAGYYCTGGRIALINGDFDEADALFEKAIHKENSAAKDGYHVRISKYLSYKSQIRVMQASAQAQEQIDALKEASISNIEVLSFFAGVIAFIIGSLSLAKGQTAADAAVLIAVLMGALLVVFSVFSLLLRLNTRRESKIYGINLAAALLGVAIVIGGIWFVSPH